MYGMGYPTGSLGGLGGSFGGLGGSFGGLGGAGGLYNAATDPTGLYGGFNRFSPYGARFNTGYTGFGAWGGFGYGTNKNNCRDQDRQNGLYQWWGPRMRASNCIPSDASDAAEDFFIDRVFGYTDPFGGWAQGYAEDGYGGWGVWDGRPTNEFNRYNPNWQTLESAQWDAIASQSLITNRRTFYNSARDTEDGFGTPYWAMNYGYNPYISTVGDLNLRGPYYNGNYAGANRIINANGLDSFGQLNNFYPQRAFGYGFGR